MAIAIVFAASAILAAADGNVSSQMHSCKPDLGHDDQCAVMSLLQVATSETSGATTAAVADVRAAVAATMRLRRKYGHDVAKATWHSALDQVTSAIQQVRLHQQRPSPPIGTGPLPNGPLPPTNVLKANPQASMQQQKAKQPTPAATTVPPATPAPPSKDAEDALETAPTVAKIAPFGKEDTATELTKHAERTQDTLVDAVENAEVAEVKRAVFRALTRLRAASIKEFDTIARLETQAIDEYNDAHHYRAENPLSYMHSSESQPAEDKYTSFH
jgi:hypothetical protein